jgi:hypothetical protein
VPFLRFSRDKRGYEHVYLVHAANRRGKPTRPRILYWYRSPPGIKVGRPPFDDEVQRLLEAQNPGMVFDWKTIVSTPMPPPEPVEHWREKRRAERAAKQARREEERDEEGGSGSEGAPTIPSANLDGAPDEPAEAVAGPELDAAADPAAAPVVAPTQPPSGDSTVRKRRRRGGRRRHGRPMPPTAEAADAPNPSPTIGFPPAGQAIESAPSAPEPLAPLEPHELHEPHDD